MKIFLDTANIEQIKKWIDTGLIDGITTNPSNLSKVGGNPKQTVLDICKLLPEGHISVEVTRSDPQDIYKQALEIAALSNNIWVKIPCHSRYYAVIQQLIKENIKLNITLVFTLLQSLMMCKLRAFYISPFVGRWDDIDVDGIEFISQTREMIDFYGFETQILAASLRTVQNFHDAIMAGADAVTLPFEIFEKSLDNPLTAQGMEKFTQDWTKLGVNHFP